MHDVALSSGMETARPKSVSFEVPASSVRQVWFDFLVESSEEERRILNFGLSSAITAALIDNRAVYLDGLGVVFPEELTRTKRIDNDKSFTLIKETVRVPRFEKCTDLISFQRQRFPGLIELRDLVASVAERIAFFIKWRPRKLERYIKGLLALIRHEVVTYGYSLRLSQFGRFFSLHNRQGQTEQDWLAGSDICLESDVESVLGSEVVGDFMQPILGSAWEPFEAWLGKPISSFTLRPSEQIENLGLKDLLRQIASKRNLIEVAVYRVEDSDHPSYIFVTEGLRHEAKAVGAEGSELVFQIEPKNAVVDDFESLVEYARGPLALGWLMAQHSKTKSLQVGHGLSSRVSLWSHAPAPYRTVLVMPCRKFPRIQVSTDGKFIFSSLILLHPDEAQAVAEVGSDMLIHQLKYRNLDQVNREVRGSILGRTGRLTKNILDISVSD